MHATQCLEIVDHSACICEPTGGCGCKSAPDPDRVSIVAFGFCIQDLDIFQVLLSKGKFFKQFESCRQAV